MIMRINLWLRTEMKSMKDQLPWMMKHQKMIEFKILSLILIRRKKTAKTLTKTLKSK